MLTIKDIFIIQKPVALVLCIFAFTSVFATENKELEDKFKQSISGKSPREIKEKFEALDSKFKTVTYFQLACNATIDWICASAIKKYFGYDEKTFSSDDDRKQDIIRIANSYKIKNEFKSQLVQSIREFFLMRTLFYPTEEESKKIKDNTDELKNKFSKCLKDWINWKEESNCIYSNEEIDMDHIKNTLKALDEKINIDDLKLFKEIEIKGEGSESKTIPQSNLTNKDKTQKTSYLKPVVIVASIVVITAFGLWAFKRLRPHQFSALNLKINSLPKKIYQVLSPGHTTSLNIKKLISRK